MKTLNLFFLLVLFLCMSQLMHSQSTVEKFGRLHTNGNKIVDKNEKTIRLAGMSFYWSNNDWGGHKFYTAGAVNTLVDSMKCNVLRVAMGVNDGGGMIEDSASNKKRVRTVVDACIAKGIYVIICFHSETAHNYKSQSIAFFKEMAKKYGAFDNVIYELNNEPGNISWSTVVKPYANDVIDTIRKYDSDNLIIVGTTNWAKDVDIAAADKIDDENVAYAFHFFPGGTYTLSTYSTRITNALDKGIALFATEWGVSSDTEQMNLWLDFMKSKDVSICNWSVNDNDGEKYSILKSGAPTSGGWFNNNYTDAGKQVKSIIDAYSVDNVSFSNASNNIESHASYTIAVNYNATEEREIHVDFFDVNNTLLGSGMLKVAAGTGKAQVVVNLDNAPAEAAGYKWRCDIREVGADFSKALDVKEFSNVNVVTSLKIVLQQTMSIIEGKENGKSFDVLLLNGKFVNVLTTSHWTLSNQPAGVVIDTLVRVGDTLVTVFLSGNSTIGTYPSNITSLTLTLAGAEMVSGTSSISANTGIVLSKAYSYLPQTYTDGTYKRINYGFYIPENFDQRRLYPLVMYLHGFGSVDPVYLGIYDQNVQNANPCFVYTPRTNAYVDAQGKWFDTWSGWWTSLTEQMTSTLEQMDILIEKYPIDTNRIYVYGISMGGEGVFELLDKRPTTFAAAISICGGGRDSWAPNIAKTPFWMFHGGKDDINPPSITEGVYNKLVSMGAKKMRYTNYPDMGHEIWNTAQNEPSFYDWMFSFSKDDTTYLKPTGKITLTASLDIPGISLSWNDIRDANSKANKIWYYNIYNSKGLIATTEYNKTSLVATALQQLDSVWVEAVNYNFQKSSPSNKFVYNQAISNEILTQIADEPLTITQFDDKIVIEAQGKNIPLYVQLFSTEGKLLFESKSTSPVSIATHSLDSSLVILKITGNNAVVSQKLMIK
ncbi:MAG: cellulase family glycosylhydrolase [Bacteroidales bacterium]|nr:cellulase family glycosylhydrolase [Bacteroidales bacterium]